MKGHTASRARPERFSQGGPYPACWWPAADDLYVGFDLQVVVSDKFVFNVHASSILPCDTLDGGVAVLFQYPACEPRVDRVRLFAKLRADVASLAPPTSLHYVAEQRVPPGAHSLRFHCDLFSERYVEYCFVYVNQAVTGAVTDIRMDCVPTLPVQGNRRMSSLTV